MFHLFLSLVHGLLLSDSVATGNSLMSDKAIVGEKQVVPETVGLSTSQDVNITDITKRQIGPVEEPETEFAR